MTFREKVDKILDEFFFKKYGIQTTYGASDTIVNEAIKEIDELASQSRKGFCLKTANKIKSRISDTGKSVSPEPK